MIRQRNQSTVNSAFSLIEMLIVVSIIGIMTSIGFVSMNKIGDSGRETVARDITKQLNQGVLSFSQANWDMVYTASPASGADEIQVLRSLQYRDSSDPAHGSPYFRPDWNPAISNNTDDYRVTWTGSAWKLLEKGDVGYGIKIVFDASDIGSPFEFPASFVPIGSH